MVRKNISGVQHKYKNRSPPAGLNAMPFRTEARKCNHWATGGLLEKTSKFNGIYIHVKCKSGFENRRIKLVKDLALMIELFPNQFLNLSIKMPSFVGLRLLGTT